MGVCDLVGQNLMEKLYLIGPILMESSGLMEIVALGIPSHKK